MTSLRQQSRKFRGQLVPFQEILANLKSKPKHLKDQAQYLRKDVKKRVAKVLERWPYDPGTSSLGPQQRKPVKRLRGATPGKASKEKEREVRKQASALQEWLGTRKGGL